MKKITIEEFRKNIATKGINIPLPFMPIFDSDGEAWVMEGTREEYRSARDYFAGLHRQIGGEMKEYCCKGLKRFIKEDKYGAGLGDDKIMISCIKEMSNDLKTCLNVVIKYCPFCGHEIGQVDQ